MSGTMRSWPVMSVAEANARLSAAGEPTEVEDIVVGGVPMKGWKNQPPTLRAVVEAFPKYSDETCLIYEDESLTYGAMHKAVAALAAHLIGLGVHKGDRVAVAMRNLPEWAAAFYAATSIGAIVTPLNAWWTGMELEYALQDSGARLAVVDSERYLRLLDHFGNCPALEHVMVARHPGKPEQGKWRRLESVLGTVPDWCRLPEQPLPQVELSGNDDATIFYTSGTTGRPKGALATHRAVNVCSMAGMASGCRYALRSGVSMEAAREHSPASVLLGVPLFHVTGSLGMLNQTLAWGGKVVMMHKWDPLRAFQLIEREKITRTGGVPAVVQQMVDHAGREGYDLSSLAVIVFGGAPAPAALVQGIQAAFPGVQPSQAWGMTETCAGVTSNLGRDYAARPQSCGVPSPVARLQVRDADDGRTVLPTGAVGELWVFGPMNCREYWNKPVDTADTFVDGWVRTGDLARLDDEGFCYIVDRVKDMIIRGGENIYSVEVENILHAHPAVAEAAVFGRAHAVLGEEPVAVVTTCAGAATTEEDLRAFVKTQLAAFKVPVRIAVSNRPLPRNENGKVLKKQLHALLEANRPG